LRGDVLGTMGGREAPIVHDPVRHVVAAVRGGGGDVGEERLDGGALMGNWIRALLDIYNAALRDGGHTAGLQVTSIARTLDPDSLWWDSMHATELMAVGLFSEAERVLLEIQPVYDENKAWVEVRLGTIYRKTGRFAEAEVWFRKAVETDPGTTMTWVHLGVFLTHAERIEEARDAFTRALEAEGDVDEAYLNLGYQKARLFDLEGARECYRKALAIDGEYVAARDALVDVETAIRVRDELRHLME
jgi:tetratricopeptide (TPR) repeat protein